MNKNFLRSAIGALALTGIFAASVQAPARADGAATTRTIVGAAAVIAGVATIVNVDQKHRVASTVVGYLNDGSTVYQDGHVVSPNGYSWYPGNQGEQVACSNEQCSLTGGNGYYGYNGGNRYYNAPTNGYYNNAGYYNNGYYYGNGHTRRIP